MKPGPTEPVHSTLANYLSDQFLEEAAFARHCGVSIETIERLQREGLIPRPSYTVKDGRIHSAVFGDMPAPGAEPGRYHRPEHVAWARLALDEVKEKSPDQARANLESRFQERCREAAASLGATLDFHEVWGDFLDGTYGLCATDPASEMGIIRKEWLQKRLVKQSANGHPPEPLDPATAQGLLELLEAYSEACMPFSPAEYPISSRKRLVDDLRPRLQAVLDQEGRP